MKIKDILTEVNKSRRNFLKRLGTGALAMSPSIAHGQASQDALNAVSKIVRQRKEQQQRKEEEQQRQQQQELQKQREIQQPKFQQQPQKQQADLQTQQDQQAKNKRDMEQAAEQSKKEYTRFYVGHPKNLVTSESEAQRIADEHNRKTYGHRVVVLPLAPGKYVLAFGPMLPENAQQVRRDLGPDYQVWEWRQ